MAARATWDAGAGRQARYTSVAILLHWTIAALILFNLATGLFHASVPRAVFAFHISTGITILALSLFRIVWRLTHRRPPYPAGMKPWERRLAGVVHFCLYAAMLAVPMSGWAMISANPPAGSPGAAAAAAKAPPGTAPRRSGGPMVWSLVKLPLIKPINEIGRLPEGLAEQRAVHDRIETTHGIGGWAILLLLVLHIGGALKHQFIDRRAELARMGIGRPDPSPAE